MQIVSFDLQHKKSEFLWTLELDEKFIEIIDSSKEVILVMSKSTFCLSKSDIQKGTLQEAIPRKLLDDGMIYKFKYKENIINSKSKSKLIILS